MAYYKYSLFIELITSAQEILWYRPGHLNSMTAKPGGRFQHLLFSWSIFTFSGFCRVGARRLKNKTQDRRLFAGLEYFLVDTQGGEETNVA